MGREVYRIVQTSDADDALYWKDVVQWTVNDLRWQWALAGGGESCLRIRLLWSGDGNERKLLFTIGTPPKQPRVGGAYGRY